MFDAARLVGAAIRAVHQEDAAYLRHHNTDFNISVLFAGQINGERMRLFIFILLETSLKQVKKRPIFK